jgi:hypothetical protein
MGKVLLFVWMVALSFFSGFAQVAPAAIGPAPAWSVGVLGSTVAPDWKYSPTSPRQYFAGVGAYGDYDFNRYLGAEAEARFVNFHTFQGVYEDTYLGGAWFHWDQWRTVPFAKVLFGPGTFRFPPAFGRTGVFPTLETGIGFDYRLTPRVKIRAEAIYQLWFHFNPYPTQSSGTLNPEGIDVGISYGIR